MHVCIGSTLFHKMDLIKRFRFNGSITRHRFGIFTRTVYERKLDQHHSFSLTFVSFFLISSQSISCLDISQFGLSSANSHWGYSSASYSPYLTGSGLSSCGTTSAAAQFNNPALGFSCSATDQTATQDFANTTRECLPSKLFAQH